MTAITQDPSGPVYYSLQELVLQHENCVAQGLNPFDISYEIALVVEQTSMADRIRGTIEDRSTMNKARDILDARNRVFFDQDRKW